jgi:hypothetical protein
VDIHVIRAAKYKAGSQRQGAENQKTPRLKSAQGLLKNLSKTERLFSSLFTWSKSP